MSKKTASKQSKLANRRTARPAKKVLHSCLSSSDQAVIASLRKISRAEAAVIVKKAGIVSESGDLNPIFR